MALFVLPWTYIPDPTQGRPVFNGKLYFGVADQDSELFPKDVELVQEDGSSIIAEQPISTNSGGTPTYNGTPVAINLLDGDYSLKILNSKGDQIYYYASLIATDNNLTENALRSAALRLNLNAALIGTVLITNDGGNDLDNAEYLIDTITGLLYSLPDDIPAGSTVVSSSGTTLVTSNGQFEMNPVWHYAVNRLIGNQTPVVEGSTGDPLPSAVETDYLVGDELAAGWEVIEVDATAVTFVDGVLNSADNAGIIRRKYKQDDAGFITKESEFGSVTLADGTQIYAQIDDISNGCRITEDSDYVCVDVDLSNAALVDGFRYHGLSSEIGKVAAIDEDVSIYEQSGLIDFSYSSSVNYEIYKSGKIRMWGLHSDGTAGATTVTFPISFPNEITYANAILSGAIPVTELNSPHIVSTTASSMIVGRVYVQNGGTVAQATQSVYWEAEGY